MHRLSLLGLFFCLLLLFLGHRKQQQFLYAASDEVAAQTCQSLEESSAALAQSCVVESIETLPLSQIPSLLKKITPPEFVSTPHRGVEDWLALTLYPAVEYAIAQRCVFSAAQHPYCNPDKRGEYHRVIDTQLQYMLASENDELQHRAMLLACARKETSYPFSFSAISKRQKSIALFLSLCGTTEEQRQVRLKDALLNEPASLDMAMLLLLAQPNSELLGLATEQVGEQQSRLSQSLLAAWIQSAQE